MSKSDSASFRRFERNFLPRHIGVPEEDRDALQKRLQYEAEEPVSGDVIGHIAYDFKNQTETFTRADGSSSTKHSDGSITTTPPTGPTI